MNQQGCLTAVLLEVYLRIQLLYEEKTLFTFDRCGSTEHGSDCIDHVHDFFGRSLAKKGVTQQQNSPAIAHPSSQGLPTQQARDCLPIKPGIAHPSSQGLPAHQARDCLPIKPRIAHPSSQGLPAHQARDCPPIKPRIAHPSSQGSIAHPSSQAIKPAHRIFQEGGRGNLLPPLTFLSVQDKEP